MDFQVDVIEAARSLGVAEHQVKGMLRSGQLAGAKKGIQGRTSGWRMRASYLEAIGNLLPIEEVGKDLNISKSGVQQLIADGKLLSYSTSNSNRAKVFVSETSLKQYKQQGANNA